MRKLTLITFLSVLHLCVSAQMVQKITDFSGIDLKADYHAQIGDTMYFVAVHDTAGEELWMTDGTPGNEKVVANINLNGGSTPRKLFAHNGKLYFRANDGTHGEELWVTDGSEAGTRMLKDINSGGNSNVTAVGANDSLVFFYAADGTNGTEIWVYSEKGDSVWMPHNLHPTANGCNSTDSRFFAVFNGTIHFRGFDGGLNVGKDLFYYDIAADSMTYYKDINPGSGAHADVKHMMVVGDKLFFRAQESNGNIELFITDGTPGGTQMVKDINPGGGSTPDSYVNIGDSLLFFKCINGTNGWEPWISDGTDAGTYMLDDIVPGNNSSNSGGSQFFGTDDGKVYFKAKDAGGNWLPYVYHFDTKTTELIIEMNSTGSTANNLVYARENEVFAVLTSNGNADFAENIDNELFVLTNDTCYLVCDIEQGAEGSGPSQGFRELSNNKLLINTTDNVIDRNIYAYDFNKFQGTASMVDFGSVIADEVSDTLAIEILDSSIVDHIVITPPSKFEISLERNGSYQTGPITLKTAYNSSAYNYNAIDTTIYVRFVPAGSEGDLSNDLEIKGIAMNTKAITLSVVAFTPVLVTDITVTSDATGDSVAIGANTQLSADILPVNATSKEVSWSVDYDTVATIDAITGELTAVDTGIVTVTATAQDGSGITGTLQIRVFENKSPVTSIVLSTANPNDSLEVGENLQILADVSPNDAFDTTLTWSVNYDTVATIDEITGILTGVNIGTVTVTATAKDGSGITGTLPVKVHPTLVETIVLSTVNPNDSVLVGEELAILASVNPDGATDTTLIWSIDYDTVATINENTGVITGISAGMITVTATATDGSNVTGSIVIEVYDNKVNSITYISEQMTIYPNPSTGTFHINNSISGHSTYKVLDITGKRIKYGNLSEGLNTINLTNYKAGMYILQINNKSTRSAFKIVIE